MELNSQKREQRGKKVKVIRRGLDIPAVVFGNEIESTPITVNLFDFEKLFKKTGETSLIDLKVEKYNYKVLVNDIQHHPVTGKPIHVSFYKPNLKEKTEVEVPVEIIGEEENDQLKSGTAVLLVLLHEVKVKALPTDLPEKFVVDVSKLENMGDHITVSQLEYDKEKVEIVDSEPDEMVVKIDSPEMETEEETTVTEAEAIEKMEATAEAKDEEEEEDKKSSTK
jgi:large subunit ribosomal protein L25